MASRIKESYSDHGDLSPMGQTSHFLTGFQSQTSKPFRTRQKVSAIWKKALISSHIFLDFNTISTDH